MLSDTCGAQSSEETFTQLHLYRTDELIQCFQTMDPSQQQSHNPNTSDPNNPRNNPPSENLNRNNSAEAQQHQNAFTVITPNETRRSHMMMMAQREDELYQRLRDTQRSAPVHMQPERLGGSGTMSEARHQQDINHRRSKLQKQLKREQEKKRQREEEDREIQKAKNIQREKAEQLERKRKQEDDRRREQFAAHQCSVTDKFLEKMTVRSVPLGMNNPAPNSSEMPKVKLNLEEQQIEHKRTNAAFLDKIDRQMKTLNLCGDSSSQSPPEPICSGLTAGEASGPDYEWALMKLMNHFPDFDRDSLNDILSQCKGDYKEAYDLLSL